MQADEWDKGAQYPTSVRVVQSRTGFEPWREDWILVLLCTLVGRLETNVSTYSGSIVYPLTVIVRLGSCGCEDVVSHYSCNRRSSTARNIAERICKGVTQRSTYNRMKDTPGAPSDTTNIV